MELPASRASPPAERVKQSERLTRSLLLIFQTNRNSKSPSEVNGESRKVKERRFILIFAVERQMKLMKTGSVAMTLPGGLMETA